MPVDVEPPSCPGCQLPWDGVHFDIRYGRPKPRSQRPCTVCGYSTDPALDVYARLAPFTDATQHADTAAAEASPSQNEVAAPVESSDFDLFVPYRLNATKLLEWQFEVFRRDRYNQNERPREEGVRMVLRGDDLCKLVEATEPDDIYLDGFHGVSIGAYEYELLREGDQIPMGVLRKLLNRPRAGDSQRRTVLDTALQGRNAVFYILSRETNSSLKGYLHVYRMFAIDKSWETPRPTAELTFLFWGGADDQLEQFFEDVESFSSDATLRVAIAATDFQTFFRDSHGGPYWATVFAQRARHNIEQSRTLMLCLPEHPGIAANYLEQALRRDQSEIQSAMANRIADRVQRTLQTLIRRVTLLTILVVAGTVVLLIW